MSSSAPAPSRSRWRPRASSIALFPAAQIRAIALEAAIVLAGAGLVAVIATWPLVLNFDTFITAPLPGNDQLGYLFDFRYAAENGLPVFRDFVQEEIAVPYGRPSSAAANLTLLATLLPATLITSFAGPIVAYNVVTLTGLALSGATMYLLVRWIGLGRGPAVWAALVYMLFPYHLFAATAFLTLVSYQAVPLVLMALVAWAVRPGLPSAAAVVVAVALCWLSFPYIGAMAIVMAGVGITVAFVLHVGRDGWLAGFRRAAALSAGIVAFVAVPLAAIAALNSGSATGTLRRPPGDLAVLGAEISDYVIPPQMSAFMGGLLGGEWFPHGSPGGERLTFIGWTTAIVLIAGLGAGFALRRSLAPRAAALLAIGAPMLVVLAACSLRSPYDLFGSQVPFPSRAVYEVFDFIRAPGRFVIAVMVPVCAIGALGLHLLGRGMGDIGRRALLAGAIVLTGAELGLGLPLPVTPPTFLVDRPAEEQAAWRWLEDHPDGAVMEYPEAGNTAIWRYYMYGWTVHHHPIVNAVHGPGDPGAEFTRTVIDPRPVETPAVLAGAGVRYVVLNRWAYDALMLRLPRAMPEGFTLAERFADGSEVWRVDATPSSAQVYFTATGWSPHRVEWDGSRVVNWRNLVGEGVVSVRVDRAGVHRVRFDATPTGEAVDVTISGAGAPRTVRVDGRGVVAADLDLPRGTTEVRVTVPDPALASVVIGPWVLAGPR